MDKVKFVYNNAVNFFIKINLFEAFAGYEQVIRIGFGAEFYKKEVPVVTNYLNNLKKIKAKFEIEFSRAKDW